MSHNTCPTVRVKCDNEQGFYVINESDFDPEIHVSFSDSTVIESVIVQPVVEETKPWQPVK